MALTLYPRLAQVIRDNPDLGRYRRGLLGHCCRAPNDRVLRGRIERFLVSLPRYKEVLEPLLH